jgi:hypothetical protein
VSIKGACDTIKRIRTKIKLCQITLILKVFISPETMLHAFVNWALKPPKGTLERSLKSIQSSTHARCKWALN